MTDRKKIDRQAVEEAVKDIDCLLDDCEAFYTEGLKTAKKILQFVLDGSIFASELELESRLNDFWDKDNPMICNKPNDVIIKKIAHALVGHVGKKIELSREELLNILTAMKKIPIANGNASVGEEYAHIYNQALQDIEAIILAHSASAHNLSREELIEIILPKVYKARIEFSINEKHKGGAFKTQEIANEITNDLADAILSAHSVEQNKELKWCDTCKSVRRGEHPHSASPKVSPEPNRITLIGHIEEETDFHIIAHLPNSGMIIEISKRDLATGSIPKEATMVDLDFNCTLAKMCEQVGIKLWQGMVMMKYAKSKEAQKGLGIEPLDTTIDWRDTNLNIYRDKINEIIDELNKHPKTKEERG